MKSLFAEMSGRVALLVTERKGKRRARLMRFKDGCAALRWCESNGAALVYVPACQAAKWN